MLSSRFCITHLQASLRRGFFCTEIGTILEFALRAIVFSAILLWVAAGISR
jgi:hypothetical protein